VSDVAQLGLAVDSSQVTGATAALKQFSTAATEAAGSADRITLANGKLGPTVQTVAAMAKNAGVSFQEMEARVKAASSSFSGATNGLDTLAKRTQAVEQANRQAMKAANDNSDAINGLGKASVETNSTMEKLANTLTRRVLFAFAAKEVRDLAAYVWNLNAAIAATADSAQRSGITGSTFQGLGTAAAYKGVSGDNFNTAMVAFNQQVELAKHGLGDLKTLLAQNGKTVGDTATTFGIVADMVKNAETEAAKFWILQQAGLPSTREFAKLMEQGSDSIKKQADAATKLTDQQLEDAKRIDEAWTRLWVNFENSAKKAVVNSIAAIGEIWNRGFGPNTQQNMAANALRAGVGTTLGSNSDVSGFYKGLGPTGSKQPAPTIDPALLRQQIAIEQQRLGILSQMATVQQQVRAVELQIQQARLNNVNITKAEADNLVRITREQALGTFQLNAQTDAEKLRVATLLMSNEAATAYTIVQTKINEARAKGAPLTEQEINDLQRSAEAYAKNKVVADRLSDALQTAKDAGQQFGATLFQGLLKGQSGMEALTAAADQLASTMSQQAMKDLFKGNFIEAGVEAVVAVAAQIFANHGKEQKALDEARAAWAKMADQVNAFNRAAAGFDLGPLTNQIQQLSSTESQLMDAAAKAKDYNAMTQIGQTFNAGVTRIVQNFKDGAAVLSPLQTSIKGVNDEASGLYDTLKNLHLDSLTIGIGEAAAAQIRDLVAKFHDTFLSGLTQRLNTAQGNTFLNDTANLLLQHAQDLAGAKDLGNDPTLLAQVAATFHAEAQKIVEDAGLVGSAFTDFTKQFPDLAGVVSEATTDMSASAKQLRESLNNTAKNIVDFVNGLYAGGSSGQSPQAQLAAATLSYNTKLGLAQGGNGDALGTITTDAQNLLTAAKAVYASSTGYQTILNNVSAQLLSLPNVQQTTDPVVAAMRDVLTAVNIGNTALSLINTTAGGTTTAVNSGNTIATNSILPAVNAGNAAAVANALSAYFNQIDPTGKLASVVGNTQVAANYSSVYFPYISQATVDTNASAAGTKTSVNAGNTTLAAIQSLQSTATTQLTLLTNALTPASTAFSLSVPAGTPIGSGGSVSGTITIQNQMVNALNKIVVNTFATARNTQVTAGAVNSGASSLTVAGVYAGGGWITGGVPGRDSVSLASGGLGMPGEFVVRHDIAQMNSSWLPGFNATGRLPVAPSFRASNDNSSAALLAEVRALREEVAKLRQENNKGNVGISAAIGQHAAFTGDKLDDVVKSSDKQTAEIRLAQRAQR
jgi:hypothetical protein